MAKNTKKLVKREFDFILTEAEYAEKARKIAELHLELDKAQLELDSAKNRFKGIEATVGEEIAEMVRVVRAKKEKRTVDCHEVMDFAAGKVVWFDPATGEEYGQRDMRHDERQMAIPGTETAETPAP